MWTKNKIFFISVIGFVVSCFLYFFFLPERNTEYRNISQVDNNKINKKRDNTMKNNQLKEVKNGDFTKERKEDSANKHIKDVNNNTSSTDSDNNKYYTSSSLDETKLSALNAAIDTYPYEDFPEIDFSGCHPEEIILVKNNISTYNDYYMITIRNRDNELAAMVYLSITGRDNNKEYLDVKMIEPYPPAYSRDQSMEDEYRKNESYPLKEKFPIIDEDKAEQILFAYLAKSNMTGIDKVEILGYTDLHINDGMDGVMQIDVKFPFYEYIINDKEKVWININTGMVVDKNIISKIEKQRKATMQQNIIQDDMESNSEAIANEDKDID